MIRNFLLVAWRNLLRNKLNSIISIAGLSIGIASVLFIALFVHDELKYDRFFSKADHIFQVNLKGISNGQDFISGNTGAAIGPRMLEEFPEVETYTRIYRPGELMIGYESGSKSQFFTERKVWSVDSNFLQVFDFPVLEGNPVTALEQPDAIVLTEKVARKYFGSGFGIGKTILIGNAKAPYIVTCILKDLPSQSSFQFDILTNIAFSPDVKRRSWNWFWLQISTYVLLKPSVDVSKSSITGLGRKFPALIKKHAFGPGNTYEDFVKNGYKLDYELQPLTSIHLYSEGIGTRLTTVSNIKYVWIFSVIAFFIIALACVNFMNLATAQALKRTKEVGIRKVLGSDKSQLIRQFLAEALLHSSVATLVALIIVRILLNPFNQVSGKDLDYLVLFSPAALLFLVALLIFTGLLAGSYPAFYLTSFRPVIVLKGIKQIQTGLGTRLARNGMIVFQFTCSIGLIICTIIVFKQLKYTQDVNMGLDKENVIVIANSHRLLNNQEPFREQLTALPWIASASRTSSIPTRVNFGDVYIPEGTADDHDLIKEIGLASFVVDEHFIPTFGINILKGRNFSSDFNDSASVILNDEAIQQIGWKDPVGKYLDYPGNSQKFKVIGVAKNFNIQSLHTQVMPFALFHHRSKTYDLGNAYIAVRVKPGDMDQYIDKLEREWKKMSPTIPFDYYFLDTEFEALYKAEKRLSRVFTIFTVLSIFIGCLGLFALAAFTAEKRAKEIGIRKVLGATVQNLVTLLSKDFVRLVLIAAFIAIPIAWYAMDKWLQEFAYRIDIQWWVFAVAATIALMIAVATVSFQAIKAAIINPVKNLRTE